MKSSYLVLSVAVLWLNHIAEGFYAEGRAQKVNSIDFASLYTSFVVSEPRCSAEEQLSPLA